MTNFKRVFCVFSVLFATIITLAIYFLLKTNEWPLVTISNGNKLRGCILKTRLNNNFYAFRAVRYGEPPIGELRFKVILNR